MRVSLGTVTVMMLTAATMGAQEHKMSSAPSRSSGSEARIRLALSAAPADIAKNAAVVEMDAKGQMKELRKGTNGWTCMPTSTGAPGAIDPMCVDKTWMAWGDAYLHKKDPNVTAVGVAYMLRGDQGASNTDPFATSKTDANQWVVSPAHVMLLLPDPKMLDTFPTDPHSGGAWIMWKGTKYAHVMVPVKPMKVGTEK